MKQNRDNAEEIQKMEAKEKWKPLREKSEGERMSIIMNLPELHPLRIRYVYFEEIFSKIYSQKNSQAFHDLSWERSEERRVGKECRIGWLAVEEMQMARR